MPDDTIEQPSLEQTGGGRIEVKPAESTLNLPDGNFSPPGEGDARHPLAKDIDSKVVNFEDFAKIIREKDPNNVEKPKEEKKDDKVVGQDDKDKVVETKTGEKAVDQKPIDGTKELPTSPQQQLIDDKAKYPDAASFFPKMAKEAREYLKARLNEVSELKNTVKDLQTKVEAKVNGELPQSYLEHPEAYTLDPKFNQAVKTRDSVNMELQYWQEQLVAIRNADKWKDLRRDKDGNLVQIEMDAGPQADVLVSQRINQAMRLIEQQENTISQIQSSFKSRYEADRNSMVELEKKYFPMYSEEKLKAPENIKANNYIKIFRDLLTDKGQGNNILTSPFAKLYALTMEQTDYIKANEARWQKAETAAKASAAAGPNSGDLNGAGEKKVITDINQKPFDYEEFKRMKDA